MASEKDATCENDPNFAVICAFFQKFSHILNFQHPDFKLLKEWLENTDQVPEGLKLLHIKLLRKLRKTVHESAWESALSKFCFGYSAQDAWEVERFGYKKSSLKVKLRILKELVESQFQRNGKFRNDFTAMNADELRSQPIGRDKLGHSYWLTQDPNLNLRIYQEHLDEEIWQVVASNRDELITLINRLKGNEVVLPSLVGIADEDTSSSNSCPLLVKPPPPEEREDEDSQEEIKVTAVSSATVTTTNNDGKVPNIKIKLDTFTIERTNDDKCIKKEKNTTKEIKIGQSDCEDGSEEEEMAEEEGEEEEEDEDQDENIEENDEVEDEEEVDDENDFSSNDGDSQDDCTNKNVKDVKRKSQKVAVNRNSNQNEYKTGANTRKDNKETQKNSKSNDLSSSSKKLYKQQNTEVENKKLDEDRAIKRENEKNEDKVKEKTKDEVKETSIKGRNDDIKIEKRIKPIIISQSKNSKVDDGQSRKRSISELIKDQNKSEAEEDALCTAIIKKARPTLLSSADREKKFSKYEKYTDEDDDEEEGEEEDEEEEEEGEEEEEEGEEEESEVPEVEDEIEEKTMIIKGVGSGEDCKSDNFLHLLYEENIDNENVEVSEAIEEDVMIFEGEGSGEDCLVGNPKDDETTDKSNFYFGQPGCLKLSPIKKIEKIDKTKCVVNEECDHVLKNDKSVTDDENKSEQMNDLKNGESLEDEKEEENSEIKEEHQHEKLASEKCEIKQNDEDKKEKEEDKDVVEEVKEVIKENKSEETPSTENTENVVKEACGGSSKIEENSIENEDKSKDTNNEAKQDSLDKNESTETALIEKSIENNEKISPAPIKRRNSIETILPLTNSNDCAKNLSIGRKRRLSENTNEKQQLSRQISESDTDINSENVEEPTILDDIDEDDEIVGGKRLKMRAKLINSEMRKKIEARRNDIEKETSSSSEAELPRKRPSPKKIETKTSPITKSKEKEEEQNEDHIECKSTDIKEEEIIKAHCSNEKVEENESVEEKLEPINKSSVEDEKNETNNQEDVVLSKEDTQDIKADDNKITVNIPTDAENDQPPTKATRSTRRSTTEFIFQDLPQPKRKARGAGRPRKNSNPRNIKATTAKLELQQQQQEQEVQEKEKVDVKTEDKSNEIADMQSNIDNSTQERTSTENKSDCQLPDTKIIEATLNETNSSAVVETMNNEGQDETEINNDTGQDIEKKEVKTTEQPESNVSQQQPDETMKATGPPKKKQQRRKREIDVSNIIPESDITPVRQSRRIAQLKIKEEAERRKLEEIALKKMKDDLKKKKKEESKLTGKPVEVSDDHSESSKEVDSEVDIKKKVERKRKKRAGWSSCTETEGEDEEDELIFGHHESDRGSPLFKSDHEFSPESELEDSSEVVPLKRARTARKEGEVVAEDVKDDQACQKCGKKDHPEWILLCDKCDKGYHCSCLSPVLFIIPEGDWFCPPCQQEQLILALENHLKEFDELLEQKKQDEIKKQIALKAAQEAEEAKAARRARNVQKQQNRQQHSQRYDDDDSEYDEDLEEKHEDENEEDEENGLRKTSKKKRKVRGRSYESRSFSSRSTSKSFSSSSSSSGSSDGSSNSSQSADSDDEPIYKLRKRRQLNVSYRFNEFDDLINSAIKDEMDEVAGAGNLGRGKDISTIIEADKEEKLRQKQLAAEEEAARKDLIVDAENQGKIKEEGDYDAAVDTSEQREDIRLKSTIEETKEEQQNQTAEDMKREDSGSDFEPFKRKPRMNSRSIKKKKSRKLNSLDISSEDDGSDEDFKTSSYETEEDEESLSVPTESESSLEVYKKKKSSRNKKPKKKKTRRAARRAARNQRKQYEYDSDFVVDDSDASEDIPKTKKKRKEDSDYTESLTDEDDLSEDVDSDELCDDSTDSDGAWRPSKRKKQKTATASKKKLLPSQKRSFTTSGKHKKIKRKDETEKSFKVSVSKKNKILDDEDSLDGGRKTRGKRFTYLEDYEEESSDDGIKPGVKRPDTPPEEREEFIRKQEEIKRMLAEKNTEAAKVVATPIPKVNEKQTIAAEPVVEKTDSLSTVPLSVIKGAKVLDMDYLQRRGELRESDEDENDDQHTEFDDDLPEDFNPEDMDEEAIAKMMEEEDFAQQQLKLAGEAIQKKKARDMENSNRLLSSETETPIRIPKSVGPILQEPPRKRLPIPTIQPPLIRNAAQSIIQHSLQTTSRINLNSPHRLVPQNATVVRPPPHIISSPPPAALGNNSVLASSRDFSTVPMTVVAAPSSAISTGHQIQTSTLQQANETEKPKGRRKKITPLRDTLQKQQAAAAAAAAAVTAAAATAATGTKITKDHIISDKPLIGVLGGSNLSIAQPPQLYNAAPNAQPSVITRMPQPSRARFQEQSSRFYPPSSQLLHRTPQRLPGIPPLPPHPSLRPSYAAGPPPLRSVNNSGLPSISIGNGLSRHTSLFGNPEQYPRTRQPLIHPPYRPPLYGTPGYPPAPPPSSQQLPSPQQSPSSQPSSQLSPHHHASSQRQQPSVHKQSSASPHSQQSPHHQQSSPLHSPSPNAIHSGANNYPATSTFATAGPFGSFFPSHSTPQQLTTVAHSIPPTVTAVPSSVIVSAGSIAAIAAAQQQAATSIPDTTAPSAPPLVITETRLKASPLETFNTKSNPSSLEAESTQSPYSSNEPADDNDDDGAGVGGNNVRSSNITSEFSGLVSYFSSQQDDLDT